MVVMMWLKLSYRCYCCWYIDCCSCNWCNFLFAKVIQRENYNLSDWLPVGLVNARNCLLIFSLPGGFFSMVQRHLSRTVSFWCFDSGNLSILDRKVLQHFQVYLVDSLLVLFVSYIVICKNWTLANANITFSSLQTDQGQFIRFTWLRKTLCIFVM